MKHLEHTFETCVYSHYNMCNIPISFCNIDIQHLQHTSETSKTLETYYCNMRFQHSIGLLRGEERLVNAKLDAGAKLDATEVAGGTNLSRGKGWQIERGHDGRHESRRGHTARAGPRGASGGGAAEGGVRPGAEVCNTLSKQATHAGATQATYIIRTTYKQHYRYPRWHIVLALHSPLTIFLITQELSFSEKH
jgi:hypothetical protein